MRLIILVAEHGIKTKEIVEYDVKKVSLCQETNITVAISIR